MNNPNTPNCWCGARAVYVNPATDATEATPVCIAHVADGYAPLPDEPSYNPRVLLEARNDADMAFAITAMSLLSGDGWTVELSQPKGRAGFRVYLRHHNEATGISAHGDAVARTIGLALVAAIDSIQSFSL